MAASSPTPQERARKSEAFGFQFCKNAEEWRAFSSWTWMIQRCQNPKSPGFSGYGGKGIRVCKRWSDFRLFLEDMGGRTDSQSIGRIDNSGHYEPSNCRWETSAQQNCNRSNSVRISVGGRVVNQSEAARKIGISDSTLSRRLKRGYSPESALSCDSIKKVKLCAQQVSEIKRLSSEGKGDREIAASFDVTRQAVSNIRRGVSWAHI